MLRRFGSLVSAALIALAALTVLAGPAAASCMPPPPKDEALASAEVAFVGTVEAVTNDGFWATVKIAEVWKGPDQPTVVEVRGSSAGPGPNQARTSVDRAFVAGTKYLFMPLTKTSPMEDNACSSTDEWQDSYAQYRPADARPPVEKKDAAPAPAQPEEEVTADGTPGDEGAPSPEEILTFGDESSGGAGPEAQGNLNDDSPASSDGGVDGRAVAIVVAGIIGLGAFGWWVRRDA